MWSVLTATGDDNGSEIRRDGVQFCFISDDPEETLIREINDIPGGQPVPIVGDSVSFVTGDDPLTRDCYEVTRRQFWYHPQYGQMVLFACRPVVIGEMILNSI